MTKKHGSSHSPPVKYPPIKASPVESSVESPPVKATPVDNESKSNNGSISTDGIFGVFSVFFLSTISLIIVVLLITLYSGTQYFQILFQIFIIIFLAGYAIVLSIIIIFYALRFFKISKAVYEKNEKLIKTVTFLIVVIIISSIFYIITSDQSIFLKIIGAVGLSVLALILIMLQDIWIGIGKPLVVWLKNWLKLKKEP